ncbi:hypothetical protein DL768_009790 [Monosporascus sp. mg162]|nr:hypothetical protein DL768_009790 [Monosporascus sp. mg162]
METVAVISESLRDSKFTLSLTCLFAAVIWYVNSRKATIYDAFPRVADKGIRSITKSTEKPFTVRWWGKDFLILPPKYLPSLRDAEWAHLSFFRTISDAFFLHTSVGDLYDSNATVQVVRNGLNPRMPQFTSIVGNEIEYALKAELREEAGRRNEKHTPSGGNRLNSAIEGEIRNAQSFLTAIVHRSATRILIGEELCRNEDFILISRDFVMSIFTTALIIVKLPLGPLREWFAYPLTTWHRRKLAQCTSMLLPVLQKRIEERGRHQGPQGSLDAIEWSLNHYATATEIDMQRLAAELMHNLWAGTSAPGGLVTDIIFQLLLEPKYKEPLLKEAAESLGHSGRWTEKALSSLPLLDSFIREVNRLYPTGSITCSRTVLDRAYVFPDGLTLPAGTRFGFPTKAMQNDADLTFDGFRFAKPHAVQERGEEDAGASGRATAMSTTNLAWGYGTHVCPGRFFAVRMVKMVVVTLLLNYDIQWDGHVDRRPAPTMIEGQFIPNLFQKIRITRRRSHLAWEQLKLGG